MEGNSEAGAEGRLVGCGRGCGGMWYCCQACTEGYCRALLHGGSCGAWVASAGSA